jgi:hypothetical protein
MSGEYRDYPDFVRRTLPLRSWVDLTRLMGLVDSYSGCPTEFDSIMVDSIEQYSLITDLLESESIINDAVDGYSLIC